MEFHPIANIFPLMTGQAFEDLCEDIKANGLREPIWLYEDKILDGRNRYRACEKVSLTPEYRTYEGDDPYGFVGSLNIHRRHLTAGQRAMLVADLVTSKHGSHSGVTARQAGALVGVNLGSVRLARSVKRSGDPRLISMIEQGHLGLAPGEVIARLPESKRRQVVDRLAAPAGGAVAVSAKAVDEAIREVSPGATGVIHPIFTRSLDEMAVRMLNFFTGPQIDLLWDIIAKKQAEMIAARRDKR